jgi:hypothetical protein
VLRARRANAMAPVTAGETSLTMVGCLCGACDASRDASGEAPACEVAAAGGACACAVQADGSRLPVGRLRGALGQAAA